MLARILPPLLLLALLVGCKETPSTPIANSQPDVSPQSNQAIDSETASSSTAASTVTERIEDAIAMLEAEKYEDFLEKFFVPAELKAVKDNGKLGDVMENFTRHNAAELLNALRSIRGAEPTMSNDQKIAWFTTEVKIASQNRLAFVNVDGNWFIPNKLPKE